MKNHYYPIQQHPDISWLYQLVVQLSLPSATLEAALQKLGILPDKTTWLHWLNLLLLGLGSCLFLSGIIFFFAYNWEDMHRFSRFAVLSGGITISTIAALWSGLHHLLGKLLLTIASVLTGVLLATFGMVYQTGADSFTLFRGWIVLILPWVLISRFQPLWLLALILVNIAAFTWINVSPSQWFFTNSTTLMIMLLSSIGIIILLLRELTTIIHQPITNARWFPRLIIFWLLFILSYIPIETIIGDKNMDDYQTLFICYYLLILTSLGYYALFVRHDLFVLACVLLSIMAVLIAVLTQLLDFSYEPVINFIIMGLTIAGMTAIASKLLLNTARKWKSATEVSE